MCVMCFNVIQKLIYFIFTVLHIHAKINIGTSQGWLEQGKNGCFIKRIQNGLKFDSEAGNFFGGDKLNLHYKYDFVSSKYSHFSVPSNGDMQYPSFL